MSASAPFSSQNHEEKYRQLIQALLSYEHVFYSPPTSPHRLHIAQKDSSGHPTIASFSLNPFLEALLHLFNCDLPAAHFLCRHAEVEPKWESMYIHGVLHRIEGDIDNTRCWYRDVKDTDAFKQIWGSSGGNSEFPKAAQKGWDHFLSRLERFRDRTRSRHGKGGWEQDQDEVDPDAVRDWKEEENLLRETSLWEMKQLLRFCEDKFGIAQMENAKQEFLGRLESGNEEHAEVAQGMMLGEGWRTF